MGVPFFKLWYIAVSSQLSITRALLANLTSNGDLPVVVYIYILHPSICNNANLFHKVYPHDYGRYALEQAVLTQQNYTVILASNFDKCGRFANDIRNIPGIVMLDIVNLTSSRTQTYLNTSRRIISQGENDTINAELYLTSAQRFFVLEDIMLSLHIKEVVHLELDNLLYAPISPYVHILRQAYTSITATPLTHPMYGLTTASVLWVPKVEALTLFTTFLQRLARKGKEWVRYIEWARRNGGCCKRKGGLYANSDGGNGIRPFFVNEMTFLTYYRHGSIGSQGSGSGGRLLYFPVLPYCGQYPMNRFVQNSTVYAAGGGSVGPTLGAYILDPGSYGQFIGGTHKSHLEPGFTDGTHIVGQAFRMSNGNTKECDVQMKCQADGIHVWNDASCRTAPFTRCKIREPWVPLFNLHVHNKKTHQYVSKPCVCGT